MTSLGHPRFESNPEYRPDRSMLPGIRTLAAAIRTSSWHIALACVEASLKRPELGGLAELDTVHRLANLPAFIGAFASAIDRPRPNGPLSSNSVLRRLARDHVSQRERLGFGAREVMLELVLLRRTIWRFAEPHVRLWDATSVLYVEEQVNTLLDEIIAECAVAHFDQATHDLSERSRRDSLTGLLNHQAFHARLEQELDRCRRYGHDLQIMYFDVDEFKQINDIHGHAAGDKALRAMSTIIAESMRDTDFAGRPGGDEFSICLVESTELAAHLMLDRLRGRLAQLVEDGSVPPGVGISAGCASFPSEAQNAHDLLALADSRQYADKRRRKADIGESTTRSSET